MSLIIKQAVDQFTDWLYNYSPKENAVVENSLIEYEYNMKKAKTASYTIRRSFM